jgi:hypothetical protein
MKLSPPATVAALAFGAWLLSLVLPVVVFEPGRQTMVRERIVTRGWEAVRMGLSSSGEVTRDRRRVFVRAMGFTNLLLPIGALALRVRREGVRRALAVVALMAGAFNQSAYFWLEPAIRSHLAIGYWVWVASFVLLGMALALPRPRR